MRVFVALDPSEEARDHLTRFLEPRWDHADGLRFTRPHTWHVTLAFMGSCPERALDDLIAGCADVARRSAPPAVALQGAGAFPDVSRARLLYAAVAAEPDLAPLAHAVRSVASKVGGAPDGGAFRPHVTLARTSPPRDATHWLHVLDTYAGPTWRPDGIRVIESHLTPGAPPRYDVLATLPWGVTAPEAP